MPSPADFRSAFNLSEGVHLGPQQQWEVASVHMGHEAVQQNERYEFPTTLTVHWRAGTKAVGRKGLNQRKQQLAKAFKQATQLKHIVYSAYGSPYECSYGPAKVDAEASSRTFKVSALGRAVRRRDIPTLPAQRAAEQKAQGHDVETISAADKAQYLRRYRVIKSRWDSGRCESCHEAIAAGSQIAKADDEKARGHWSHAACVLHRLKGEQQQQQSEDSSQEPSKQEQPGEQRQGRLAGRSNSSAKRGRKRPHSADSRAGVADSGRGMVTRRRAAAAN